MSKCTFPESTGIESEKPATSGGMNSSDIRNALGALFQGDMGVLRPRAQTTPDMTIHVNPAALNSFHQQVWGTGNSPVSYAGGNTSAISAPSSLPRIDIVYLTAAGALAIVTGAEAASPVALWASLPKDGIPLCLIYCKTTMTTIVNYEDKDTDTDQGYIYSDVRPFLNLGGGATLADMQTAQDNIALLAFRLAVQGALTIQKMEDGIVDEYEDESGVDTGASTATYDASGDYYSNNQGDQTGSGTALSGGDATAVKQSNTTPTAGQYSNAYQGANVSALAETFTASEDYGLKSFSTYHWRYGALTGTGRGAIYATSGGAPTGSPLAQSSNTLDLSTLPTSDTTKYTWTFDTPVSLTSGTVYALVIELTGHNMSGSVVFYVRQSNATYAGSPYKKDSGVWSSPDQYDFWFQINSEQSKANAVDDSTSTYWGSSQTSGSISGAGYIGYDFGVGVTKAITGFTIKQHHADQAIDSVKVQRSDNGSDWTDVETVAITADTSAQTKSFTNTTSARYWRLLANDETTSGSWEVEEVGFTLSEDLELVSESFEAEATPTEARVCVFLEEVDAITLNTDFKAYVSRDDGTNWTQITLTNEGEYETGKDILSGSISVSAQPSDKTMRYKLITDNLKVVKIHGASLSWKS